MHPNIEDCTVVEALLRANRETELTVAAHLICGSHKLWASCCIPDDNGDCGQHVITKCTLGQLRKIIRAGYGPVVYSVSVFIDDFATLLEEEMENSSFDTLAGDGHVCWLGDIGRSGDVICGELLSLIVSGR